MKDFLTVHDIGNMFGISVQTLHYYDSIGLFQPNYRDRKNGYRKYRFDQIYQLASIRYLRKMEYSVSDIKQYLGEREKSDAIDMLKQQSVKLHARAEALVRISDAILSRIQYVETEMMDLHPDDIFIQEYPELSYHPLGTEADVFHDDSFYFYPTLCFYEPEKEAKYFGALILDDKISSDGDDSCANRIEHIPAGKYAVGYHRGPYETIHKTFDRIKAHYPELLFCDYIATFNIIDQFVETDTEAYITEIRVRIQP